MAVAYVSNIVISSGSDFEHIFSIDSDLSGYNALSQLRKYSESPSFVSFACTVISSPQSPQSAVVISLTSEETKSLKSGRYVYDVLLEGPQNQRSRIVEGMVLVSEGVTKID
jgi:hypothetical protein